MIPKVQVYIESVVLGIGAKNRGAGCAILLLETLCNTNTQKSEPQPRKVVTQYFGEGVKSPDIVKRIAVEAVNQLKTLCDVAVYSSARQPRGFRPGAHPFTWRAIPEGSEGWQMRAAGAAWEVALGGAVTREILELAATDPIEPVRKGLFIYASTWA